MKILIAISDSFCANFIKGQGKFLKQNGHEVVVVSAPGEEIDMLERIEGVRVVRIAFRREIAPLSDFLSLLKVIRLIWREKPDVINAGNPKTGFLFSLAHLLFLDTPLVFTLRGLRSDTLSGMKRKVVRLTERISCGLADKVIAISPSLRDYAVSQGVVRREKCEVLGIGSSNGVDTDYFTKTQDVVERGMEILSKFDVPITSFRFIFVGRVTKDKGLVEVLDAFSRVEKEMCNVSLLIVGPMEIGNPLPKEYYQLIENHPSVYYLGKLLDVRPVYSVADALVLYSHREGFGNVVIEGASMGLPTIVADIPGLRDTTQENMSGVRVKPKDADALYEAMMSYLIDPDKAKRHGEYGAERARQFFKNETIWKEQVSLYKSMLV